MSYILDALKKVELEKTKKISSGGITRVSGDLFLETKPRTPRRSVWKISAMIAAVSLVAAAALWVVLKGYKKGGAAPRSSVQAVVSAPQLQPAAPPAPPPPAPPASPPPQAAPPEPLAASAPKAAPAAAAVNATEPAGKTGKKPAITSPALPASPKPAVQTVPAPAEIKVSGIAWQDEPALRRTVVNGLLLKEGATIAGAKILEIQKNKVRFSSPAGIFDAIINDTK